jgi:hypothetical protein
MQLIPADPIRIMAAFERDGALIPLQQPVKLKASANSIVLQHWPGEDIVCRNARATGCYRWLPQGMAAAAGQPPATCVPHEQVQPGLLVIQLESGQQGRSREEGGAPADAQEGTVAASNQGQGEEGQGGEMAAGHNVLATAAACAAVTWHPDTPGVLLLQLPFQMARHFSSVVLELGSALLPQWVTGEVRLKPHGNGASHTQVAVRKQLRDFMCGAELLPCKTVPASQDGRSTRWNLVLRAAWPRPAAGEPVGARACKHSLMQSHACEPRCGRV